MRILYLAHRVPYPPNKGEKIRSFHHLRHLSEAHHVDLVAYYDRREDAQWTVELKRVCRHVALVPLPRIKATLGGAAKIVAGDSFSRGYFDARPLLSAAADLSTYDVIWSSSASIPLPASANGRPRRVVDFVDVDSEKWLEFARVAAAPLAWGYGLEGRRLTRLEGAIATEVDRALVVSESEAEQLRHAAPQAHVAVIPNGVDFDYFRPADRTVRPSPQLVFVGTLDYRPNVDAVLFFVREVLPLLRSALPGIQLTAVGHRPSLRLRLALRDVEGVRVAASVPDVRPYWNAAAVCIVPLRYGRGVKNKVLEAMAMGVPVVGSRVAVEGLAVRDGHEVLLAETPRDYAEAVRTLLRDPERRARQVAHALEYVHKAHSWERGFAALDACLESFR